MIIGRFLRYQDSDLLCRMLRVSLNAEETVTVFPALFFIRRQAEGG